MLATRDSLLAARSREKQAASLAMRLLCGLLLHELRAALFHFLARQILFVRQGKQSAPMARDSQADLPVKVVEFRGWR